MGLFQDYIRGAAMARNPALLQRRLQTMDAQAMKGTIDTMYGQQELAQETAPYQMGEGEMMEGEVPIQGLMDITQEAQEGSGLLGSAGSDEERRYLQARKVLGMSGNREGLEQSFKGLNAMQNSVMSNYGGQEKQRQMNQAKLANPQLGRAESGIEYWQRDPTGFKGMQDATKRASTTVNVNSKLRDIDKQIEMDDRLAAAKTSRQRVTGIVKAGTGARQEMAKTDRMMSLLDSGDAKTGFGQEQIVLAKQVAQTFGIDASTASAEELQVLMGDLVMKRVAETKGAVSEKEMDLFRQYSANFGKSPEGNRAILNFYKSMLERDKLLAGKAKSWRKEGLRDSEISDRIDTYMDENPLDISVPKTAPPKYKKEAGYEYRENDDGTVDRRKL